MDSAEDPAPASLSEKPIPSPIDTTTPNLPTPDPSTTGHSAKKKRSKRNANPVSPTTPTNEATSEAEDEDEDGPESPSLGPENEEGSLPPTPMSASGILPLSEDSESPVISTDNDNRPADSSAEGSLPQPNPEEEKSEDSSNHDHPEGSNDSIKEEIPNDDSVSHDLVEHSVEQDQQESQKDSSEESIQISNRQEDMIDQSTLHGENAAIPESDVKNDPEIDLPECIAVPIETHGQSLPPNESEAGETESASQVAPLTEPSKEGNESEDQSHNKDSPLEEISDVAEPVVSAEKVEEDATVSTSPQEPVELSVLEEGITVEPVVAEESGEAAKDQRTSLEVTTGTTLDATHDETTKGEEPVSENEKAEEISEISEAIIDKPADSIPVEGNAGETEGQEKVDESLGPTVEMNESSVPVPATDIGSCDLETKTSKDDGTKVAEDMVGPEKVSELEEPVQIGEADLQGEPQTNNSFEAREPERVSEPSELPEPHTGVYRESNKNAEEPSPTQGIDEQEVVPDHRISDETENTVDADPEAESETQHEPEAAASLPEDRSEQVEPTAPEDHSKSASSDNLESEESDVATSTTPEESTTEGSSTDFSQGRLDNVEIDQELQESARPAGEEVKPENFHEDVPAQHEPEAEAKSEETLPGAATESTESGTPKVVAETEEEVTVITTEIADLVEKPDDPVSEVTETDKLTEVAESSQVPETKIVDTAKEATDVPTQVADSAEQSAEQSDEQSDEAMPKATEPDKSEEVAGTVQSEGVETAGEVADMAVGAANAAETLDAAALEGTESEKPGTVADVQNLDETVPGSIESGQPEEGAEVTELEKPAEDAEVAVEVADTAETLDEVVLETKESETSEEAGEIAQLAEAAETAEVVESVEKLDEVMPETPVPQTLDDAVPEVTESEHAEEGAVTPETADPVDNLEQVTRDAVPSQVPGIDLAEPAEEVDVAAEAADTAEKLNDLVPEVVESVDPQNVVSIAAEIVDVPTDVSDELVSETVESMASEQTLKEGAEFADTADQSNEQLLEAVELEPSAQDKDEFTRDSEIAKEMGEQEKESVGSEIPTDTAEIGAEVDSTTHPEEVVPETAQLHVAETEVTVTAEDIAEVSDTAEKLDDQVPETIDSETLIQETPDAVEVLGLDIPDQGERGVDITENAQVSEAVESAIPKKVVEPTEEIVSATTEDGDIAETPDEQAPKAIESQTAELEGVVAIQEVTDISDKLDEQFSSVTEVKATLDSEYDTLARDGSETLEDSQNEFKVSLLPASDNAENPVHLVPGEPTPDVISSESLDTHVRVDQESNENSEPVVPVVLREIEESVDVPTNDEDGIKILPLPAFENAENPIHLLPGEPIPRDIGTQSLNTHVTLDRESYESSEPVVPVVPTGIEESVDVSPNDGGDEVKISPLPAFENAINPISLEPCQPIPDGSNAASIDNHVTLDEGSYENTNPNVHLSLNEDKPANIPIKPSTSETIPHLSTKDTDLADVAVEQQEMVLSESAKLKTDGICETPDTSAVLQSLPLPVVGFGIDDIIPVDDSLSEAHVALPSDQTVAEIVDESTNKAVGKEMLADPATQSASSAIHGVSAPGVIPKVLKQPVASGGSAPTVVVSPPDVDPNDNATNPTVETIEPTPSEPTSGGIKKRNTSNPSQDRPASSGSDIVSTRRHNRNIMNTFWHIFFFGWLGGVGRFFGGIFGSKRKGPKRSSATP